MWYKVVQTDNKSFYIVGINGSIPAYKIPIFKYDHSISVANLIKMLAFVEPDSDIVYDKSWLSDKDLQELPTKTFGDIFDSLGRPKQDPKHSESNPVEQALVALRGKIIVLDPGHSEASTGAKGFAPDYPQEEDMNRLQAQIIARRLTDVGAKVKIYDPIKDDLADIGRQAKGADMFISIHLNAYNANGFDEYAAVMVHRDLKRTADIKFAEMCALKIAKSLQHRIFKGHMPAMPQGVYQAGLGVLRAAIGTGCPVCVLTEAFFIDDYGSNKIVTERSTKAANAIADSVIEWFKK